ncbi:FAD-binding oxidoreductase [Krasilnikoviella flava]|uniref:FAD/FMN-containing dehydrogenase n=1 Tax=Krasilnikoviella flava TaxID=526729 RepID=A0A1T5L5L3_9MICO|nr:FAD-binding oxidoreductase [Krasilnikoviella flava]SKC71366.1 FAD/FMN-containing dehydrogenase [Krasilnikoviella flava]
MSLSSNPHTSSVSPAGLRAALGESSPVVTPQDEGYAAARAIEPGGVDHRPAAVVRPADTQGVARAVHLAHDAGAEVSVRAGGHSVFGLGAADGAVTLDLRGLDGIELDVDGRTAWAGGGITAGAYSRAAGEHGLATPFGDTGTVGVGGITLGGGVGLLSRSLGMTIDSLLGAEVVTADGQVVLTDADREPDLFWALRGGGGNFGVVTRFRFALHEVSQVVGGVLLMPATAASIAGVVAAADAAPAGLTVIAMVMTAPPMPMVPAEWHGRVVVMANTCWSGPLDEADTALAPLRDVAARAGGALLDGLRTAPYSTLLEGGPPGGPVVATGRTFFADGVDEAAAAHLLEQLQSSDAMMRAAQLRVLGGAVADVPSDATAYAHRAARVVGNVAAVAPDAATARGYRPWVDALADRLRGGDGAYVNFSLDGGLDTARAAYPGATWDRLRAVKRRWDPQNLFRGNVNVPPA